MKILLIHHKLPYPLHSGLDKMRYMLIKTLSKNHNVTLIVPVNKDDNESSISQIKSICHNLITVNIEKSSNPNFFIKYFGLLFLHKPVFLFRLRFRSLEKEIISLVNKEKFDIVQALSIYSGFYLYKIPGNIFKVLGPQDDYITVAKLRRKQERNLKEKIFNIAYEKSITKYQKDICNHVNFNLFCSEADKNEVNKYINSPSSEFLPVTTEEKFERYKYDKYDEVKNSIIFVGALSSHFNIDAILYFHEFIYPIIMQKIPDLKFYIVGANPTEEIKKLSSDKIIVTGEVHDVKEFIARAQVYISPLKKGTGLKTKIIEALSMGKAIVSTSQGVHGLWSLDHKAVKVVDEDVEFANAIISLLKNDNLRKEAEKKSESLFKSEYAFDSVFLKTLGVYKKIQKRLSNNNLI